MGYRISQDFREVWAAVESGDARRVLLVSFGPAFIFVIFDRDGMGQGEELRIGREALRVVLSTEDKDQLQAAGVDWRTFQPDSRCVFLEGNWISDRQEVLRTWRVLKLPPPWLSRRELMDQAISRMCLSFPDDD